MTWKTFDTPITDTGDALIGPSRAPQQMLAAQEYDDHASIHDDRLPVRGPALGLFADQEIRLLQGPLFACEDYEVEREVVAITGPPHRKHVAADHGVCFRLRRPDRDDVAQQRGDEGILRAIPTAM